MVNYLVVHQLGSKYSNLEIETEIEMSFSDQECIEKNVL